MATLEDLGRMAMVEIHDDLFLVPAQSESGEWGKLAFLLAASAAICGLVVGVKRSSKKEPSR